MNSESMTIGALAKAAGVSTKTIRFYEGEGVLPEPPRTAAGYRAYGVRDVRRLRLVRSARLLGLPLDQASALVRDAFASNCADFAPRLGEIIATRRGDVRRRIAELRQLDRELAELQEHVAHSACATDDTRAVQDCDLCSFGDLIQGQRKGSRP